MAPVACPQSVTNATGRESWRLDVASFKPHSSLPDRLTMPFSQRRSRRPSISGGKHAGWSGLLPLCFSLALALAPPLAAQARAPRVALILDRDNPRFHPLIAAFEREIRAFFRPGEIELLPPVAGDGTASGVGAVLK